MPRHSRRKSSNSRRKSSHSRIKSSHSRRKSSRQSKKSGGRLSVRKGTYHGMPAFQINGRVTDTKTLLNEMKFRGMLPASAGYKHPKFVQYIRGLKTKKFD